MSNLWKREDIKNERQNRVLKMLFSYIVVFVYWRETNFQKRREVKIRTACQKNSSQPEFHYKWLCMYVASDVCLKCRQRLDSHLLNPDSQKSVTSAAIVLFHSFVSSTFFLQLSHSLISHFCSGSYWTYIFLSCWDLLSLFITISVSLSLFSSRLHLISPSFSQLYTQLSCHSSPLSLSFDFPPVQFWNNGLCAVMRSIIQPNVTL